MVTPNEIVEGSGNIGMILKFENKFFTLTSPTLMTKTYYCHIMFIRALGHSILCEIKSLKDYVIFYF